MANVEKISTRIVNKNDTAVGYTSGGFAPLDGELLIVNPDGVYDTVPKLKVGDGKTAAWALPTLSTLNYSNTFTKSGYIVTYSGYDTLIGSIGNTELRLSKGNFPTYLFMGTDVEGTPSETINGDTYLTFGIDNKNLGVNIVGTSGTSVTTDTTGAITVHSPNVEDVVSNKVEMLTLYDLLDTDDEVIIDGGTPSC